MLARRLLTAIVCLGVAVASTAAARADMNDPLATRLTQSLVSQLFPDADGIATIAGDPPIAVLTRDGEIVGYMFSTHETMRPAGYSGLSFDIIIALDGDGVIRDLRLLEGARAADLARPDIAFAPQSFFDTVASIRCQGLAPGSHQVCRPHLGRDGERHGHASCHQECRDHGRLSQGDHRRWRRRSIARSIQFRRADLAGPHCRWIDSCATGIQSYRAPDVLDGRLGRARYWARRRAIPNPLRGPGDAAPRWGAIYLAPARFARSRKRRRLANKT